MRRSVCERAYLPDPGEIDVFRAGGPPLLSLETQRPVADAELIAFSASFENDYPNLVSLFEHLDVRGDIAFGARRVPATEHRVSIEHAIELLGLGGLLDREPSTLSGGERQRVAIARALAVSPKLLLMDEPLAAVDLTRKQEILPWIESLHRDLDIPVIHVSHLPEEVARFADHVVLIDATGVVARSRSWSSSWPSRFSPKRSPKLPKRVPTPTPSTAPNRATSTASQRTIRKCGW